MTPEAMPEGPMTFRQFVQDHCRIPDRHGGLVPLIIHPIFNEFILAMDARVLGERPYDLGVLSLQKKVGKTVMVAAYGDYEFLLGPFAPFDREVYIIASVQAQATNVTYQHAVRFVTRHPYYSTRVKVGANEMTFTEQKVDPRTGGRFTTTHILRALPKPDRSLEGLNPSCVIFDEAWTHDSWEGLEGLSLSPARRCPIQIWSSFAGLRSQQRPGVPWFDVVNRGRSGDPRVALVERTGPNVEVPWHTDQWRAAMRKQYEFCLSRYLRLAENKVAAADDAAFSAEEIFAALDDGRPEAERGEAGVRHQAGLDVGLTVDETKLVIGHVDRRGVFVVDVVRGWKGTRTKPVNLTAVEAEVLALHRRFPLASLSVDQWQSKQLQEGFIRGGIPVVKSVVIEPAWLDRAVTVLKRVFAQRLITIPRRDPELREQLESLVLKETRRDRLRFDSGRGPTEAGRHDDAVIALTLALMQATGAVGRRSMPTFACAHAAYLGRHVDCCIANPIRGMALPLDTGGAVCRSCKGWQAIEADWRASGLDLRRYCRERVTPSVEQAKAEFCKMLDEMGY